MEIQENQPRLTSGYKKRLNRDKIGNVLQIIKFLDRYDLSLTVTAEGTLVVFDNYIDDVLRIDSYEDQFISETLGMGEMCWSEE